MDKLLFKPTKFSELERFVNYTIHFGDTHYIGMCTGKIDEPKLVAFLNVFDVESVPKTKTIRTPPLYVNDTRTFKRIIYKNEQIKAYREAFEKRAVNQIVSSVIGHWGDYY